MCITKRFRAISLTVELLNRVGKIIMWYTPRFALPIMVLECAILPPCYDYDLNAQIVIHGARFVIVFKTKLQVYAFEGFSDLQIQIRVNI